MKATTVNVLGAVIYEIDRYRDQRGFFEVLYSQQLFPHFPCIQLNCSKSSKNVIRGVHVVPFAKLVHCIKGRVFDVVVDTREGSPTYLQWYGVELCESDNKSFFIPAGCGHGFMSLEDDSMILYGQDALYNPNIERAIRFDDPKVGVKWPVADNYIVSEKDRAASLIV